MSTSYRNWSSGLPDELLESISNKISSPFDHIHFRSVCPTWRSSTPALRFPPLLMFPFDTNTNTLSFYSLHDERELTLSLPETRGKVLCGSSHGWLVFIDEIASISLFNPFTKSNIDLPRADENIAIASYKQVEEMVDGRWIVYSAHDGSAAIVTLEETKRVFFKEIILSAPPINRGGDFVAVGVLACSEQIAFCRNGDATWTLIDTNLSCNIESVVFCGHEKVYAMDCVGEMAVCHISNPPKATILPTLTVPTDTYHWKLLVDKEELFLVTLISYNTGIDGELDTFEYVNEVYRAVGSSTGDLCWYGIENIGSDNTIFVSTNFGLNFFKRGNNLAGCKGNCIYLSEVLCKNCNCQEQGVHPFEVVDLTNRSSQIVVTREGKFRTLDGVSWFKPNLC